MNKYLFVLISLIGLIGVATAISADYLGHISNPSPIPMANTMPDGSPIPEPASESFDITGLINYFQNENMNANVLFYKVIVPDDVGTEWNTSQNFMERKPTLILKPINNSGNVFIRAIFTSDYYWAYACCNVTQGDLLYTTNASNPDGSFNFTLAGTLTNNYDTNWKTRVYNGSSSSWGNVNVGKAQGVDAYNRRALLSSDGVFVGYARQSINVTVPTLIKIYKV